VFAFSFYLKRFVTLKKCWQGVCGWGFAPDSAVHLTTLPRSPRLGRGHPLPNSRSPRRLRHLNIGDLGASFYWNPPNFFLHMALLVGRQLLRTDWMTYAVCTTIMESFSHMFECIILHSRLIAHLRNRNLLVGDVTLLKLSRWEL